MHHRRNMTQMFNETQLVDKTSIEEALLSQISELLTKNETLHDAIDKKKNAMPIRSELRSAASRGTRNASKSKVTLTTL